MSEQYVIDVATGAVWLTLKVAAPALIAALVVGILISVIQAATQVQEQTVSFVPKIIAITASMIITGPWILQQFIFYTKTLIQSIPNITR
ncbi:MAG: flagellar biosynthesis protein FliQ [Pseudomonadota bacterium]